MKKNFSEQLTTAHNKKKQNTVEGTPLIDQHDELVEEEINRQAAAASSSSPQPTPSVSPMPQMMTSQEKTKGIVVDVPLSIYYRLRSVKDVYPTESFKSLALAAIIEFVERKEQEMGKA